MRREFHKIGALGGYSGICLARGFGKPVTYLTSPALESMKQLIREKKKFVFLKLMQTKKTMRTAFNWCVNRNG